VLLRYMKAPVHLAGFSDQMFLNIVKVASYPQLLCRDEFWSRSRVTAPSAECKMRDIGASSPSEVQKR
jgi:hypothetical protein